MTESEKKNLQAVACKVRMGIIEGTHGAKAGQCGQVITCEEHSIIGGLGEAVCSLLSEKLPTKVARIGINDEFGHSGPAGALLKQFGLCAKHIADVAQEICSE